MSRSLPIAWTVALAVATPAALAAQRGGPASPATLAGDWTWMTEFQEHQSAGTMKIVRSDTAFIGSGTQSTPGGAAPITLWATLRDSTVTLRVTTEQGTMPLIGRLRGDSMIVGSWQNDEGNAGTFSLKRVAAKRP